MKSLLFQFLFVSLFVAAFLLTCAFFNARLASASTVLFSDNFPPGDISNWTLARNMQWQHPSLPCMYHGQAASWQVISNQIGIVIDGPPCITELIPKNLDLSAHPTYVYEFDWTFAESTKMDRVVLFKWHDTNNWYDVKILENTIQIQKVINGEVLSLPQSARTYPFAANRTYHFMITVQAGTAISVNIDGKRALSVQDQPPYISGFFTTGLQAGVGAIERSVTAFSHLFVHTLDDDLTLPVTLLKQTDPQWRDHEYDTAEMWTKNPTIGRWGCALTSMTMILRFYGITIVPDGTLLTPDSLNTWLKSQADGYIGSLVNWIAVTRLTRLVNQKLGTPKLEYGRQRWSVDTAASEITQRRPVILQMPGHFFVGNGISSDHSFISTLDPFYSYTRSNQYPLPLISVRTFLPSFTDLSYLLVTHPPEVNITIDDTNGFPLPTQTDDDFLIDQANGDTSPHLVQTLLAKPSTGTYTIQVSRQSAGPYDLGIYSYDKTGEPSIQHTSGFTSATPVQIQLQYQKTASSSAQSVVTLFQVKNDLETLHKLKQIKTFAYLSMNRTTTLAMGAGPARKLRYLQLLAHSVQFFSATITQSAQDFLTKEIKSLVI